MTVSQDQHGVWRFEFWKDLVRHQGACLDKEGKRVTTKTAAKMAQLLERARALEGEPAGRVTVRAGDYSLGKAKRGAGIVVPAEAWRPLRSLGSSWRKSVARAGVEQPHRFHDVRARYITAVAQTNKGVARQAARHQHSATTDLYIQVGDEEVAQAVTRANAQRPKPAARSRLSIVK